MESLRPLEERDRAERRLALWRRVELPVALVLMAAGFAAIAVGWVEASSTADVRIQLQAFLSGGFGGLGLIVAGAAILQSHVSASSLGSVRERLDRVADALVELAREGGRDHGAWMPAAPPAAPVEPVDEQTLVLASHASYHAEGCDLAEEQADLRPLTIANAQQAMLRPCRVCLPTAGAPA